MPIQLTLPLCLPEENRFANFYAGRNRPLLHNLKQMAEGLTAGCLYLWGHPGAGCSHLLQASYHYAQQAGRSAAYVPLAHLRETAKPDILQGAEQYQLVCIDEVGSSAADLSWEEALFHLWNRLSEQNIPLILAAHAVPSHLGLQLPDLASRFSSGLLFQVHALKDSEKLLALQGRARLRGIHLSQPVGEFLLSRMARHPAALFRAFERLALDSLRKQRRLTVPFVKEILGV